MVYLNLLFVAACSATTLFFWQRGDTFWFMFSAFMAGLNMAHVAAALGG